MSDKMNILFLMDDQHNPDFVGYSGKGLAKTPNIDWIAQGTSFINAISPNPVCAPTRCSLLTGKWPHQVGMMTMSGDLSPQYPTYMKALKTNGYKTIGIGKYHILQGWHWDVPRGKGHNLHGLHDEIKKFGFDEVWEAAGKGLSLKNYGDYCEYLNQHGLLEQYRDELEKRSEIGHPEAPDTSESFGIAEQHHAEVVIADQIIKSIKNSPKDQPFCIFGSFLSPHPIIDPPERLMDESWEDDTPFLVRDDTPMSDELQERWRKNRKGYRALVHLIDEQIGRIIKTLEEEELLDNTIIIFTSDHGDMLGNFGFDGKNRPWRESVSVPLAIRHPDYVANQSISSPVSLIDITATILDAAGIDAQKALSMQWPAWNHVVPCKSLLPIIKGDCDTIREFAFSENDNWEMIQTEDFKYIRYRSLSVDYESPREELYHLTSDPDEIHDISNNAQYSEILNWCRQRREHTINSTPAGQIRWAPIEIDKGYPSNYKGIAPYFELEQKIPGKYEK